MNSFQIAIIINSFNRLDLLKHCMNTLSSAISQSGNESMFVAVVYEAGSSDGSSEWLREERRRFGFNVDIITPKVGDDTSFSAGVNAAVAYAQERYINLEYLLLFETDNQIQTFNPISQAIDILKSKEKLAACGFTVRQVNGRFAGAGQPFPTVFNFLLGKNLVHHFNLETIPFSWEVNKGIQFSYVDVVYTSPLLVKLQAWRDSQGLDAKVFPFSDCDVDWARRLRDLGWQMGVIKTSEVIHDNLDNLSNWSQMRAVHSHRGRLRYLKRHRPISVLFVWPVLLLFRHLIELSGSILVNDPVRRNQLTTQFFTLFKKSISGYR